MNNLVDKLIVTATSSLYPRVSAHAGIRLVKPYKDSPRLLRIFLCHATDDKKTVRRLHERLQSAGFEPWLDEERLLPGQRWRDEIPRAVQASDLVIVCLSKASISKAGYVQREIKYSLDVALQQPESTIFLIPLRLEECEVPGSLQDWQWVDYFEERGYERLKRALDFRAEALKITPTTSQSESSGRFQDTFEANRGRWLPTDPSSDDAPPVKVSTAVNAQGDWVLPHAIGIETLGGVFSKMIPEGTLLPHQLSEIFSTASDNQTSVEIHVLAGLRPLAQQNLSLGKFHLIGIPPAPRGMPQIELTLDINVDGLLNVSAKDLTTGRAQRITIKSPSGQSIEEIEKIMRDAQQHSEGDRLKREEIALRNRVDGLSYQLRKTASDLSERLDPITAAELKLAISQAQESLNVGGKSRLETALASLESASKKMANILYLNRLKSD